LAKVRNGPFGFQALSYELGGLRNPTSQRRCAGRSGVMNMTTAISAFNFPAKFARSFFVVFVAVSLIPNPRCVSAQSAPAQAPKIESPPSTSTGANRSESTLSPEQFGDLQMVRKQYQAAIQSYGQAEPKTATIWNKIGIANQQMFINEEAKKDYQTALKLDPKNPDVMNNLATVYYSLKEYSYAEHMYRKALKHNPKSALIYKNLGTDLLAQDKFKKGWDCYQTALSIDPEIFERINLLRIGEPTATQKRGAMNYYLAKSYARVGMPDLAVGYLRMAIDEGFTDRKRVLADKEFANLRDVVSFQQLIAEQSRQ
jgi:Tfp pilus assembly protein PilF